MSLTQAAQAFQFAIFTRLNNDAELRDVVSGVYDFVPQRTPLPYCALNVLQVRDASSRQLRLSNVTANITIWSDYHGKLEALGIADIIETLLTRDTLTLDNGMLIDLQHISQTHDVLGDNRTRRTQLRYRATIQENETW